MGWDQWMLLRVSNKSSADTLKLKFPNAGDHWGYPFAGTGDLSDRIEISYAEIEDKDIAPHASYAYGHTGRENAPSGLEGTVDILEKGTGGGEAQRIAQISYNCPWDGSNTFVISDVSAGWDVKSSGEDFEGNALGSITIEVSRT
ncbi:hypothetical protein JX265_006922 [Neoarthrinium moseri]|uniref:Uncharacterized protein n=1 Tax=Neoarthrinium moseri TaxID=1658444 RepID=A0A9Q0AP74_9PEZI|nr:uncharacterized protein JN550_002603 [Neoarthrinium moseri]KAI1840838.1 hypothetical protein JX266_012986 [Neoarthrinium moseri]KAI1868943.1 hypothetical protein JX265_006922 [Neoarthrinium moseri]KAI1874024.1 hypothetical protein JN550_002603 [Neoarthrinium moseri]